VKDIACASLSVDSAGNQSAFTSGAVANATCWN
jgi:hypothetical protein